VVFSAAWVALSNGAAATGIALDVARYGWQPNWGLGLYLLVQCQLGLPLLRDLLKELWPTRAPSVAVPFAARLRRIRARRTGMLPRRWPEALAVSASLVLIALLASGQVSPMLP
jgi:cellulose synthase (UDP-forming)